MYRLTDFLEVHWLTVALLIAAALAVVRVFLRRSAGRGTPPFALAVAYTCGLLGLGALLVPSWAFALSEWRFTVAQGLVLAAAFGFVVAGLVLAFLRAWSFWVGVVLGGVALLGLGGWAVRQLAGGAVEVVRSLRGLEFVRPEWLALLVFVPLVVLMSRRSLSGLGPTRKWTAITLRALGVACLAMALAEPRIRRASEHVTVLFVVDRSFSVPQDLDPDQPATEAVDRRWEHARRFIEEAVRRHGQKSRHDQAGLILFGKRPRLALPPSAAGKLPVDERMAGPIDGNYTDIAAAIKLALASFPEGTGKRIVLVSDGNENIGNAEEQANLAKQNGVRDRRDRAGPRLPQRERGAGPGGRGAAGHRPGPAAADPRPRPQRHPGPGGGRPAGSPQVVARPRTGTSRSRTARRCSKGASRRRSGCSPG